MVTTRAVNSFLFSAGVVICAGVLAGPVSANPIRFDGMRVVGNTRLSDAEVLALCDLDVQHSYSPKTLQDVVQCLGASGEFKSASLDTEGRTLLVKVNEAPKYTGLLDLSVSADTDRGLSGRVYLEDRDLFDRGLLGAAELEAAKEEQAASLTLTNQNLWGRGYAGSLALQFSNQEYDDQTFDYWKAIFASFITIPVGDAQSFTFRGGVQVDEMYNISSASSPTIQSEGGRRTTLFAGLEYASVFKAENGAEFSFQASQVLSGLGEDYLASNTRIRGNVYAPIIDDKLSLFLEIEAGSLRALGTGDTRIVDRFFLGGSSLRGFAPRGIGPIDGADFLGGNNYAVARAETRSPLGSYKGVKFTGGAFVDAGSVWGLDNTAGFSDPIDDGRHISVAAGLTLTAQFGEVPVTLFYAKPIQSQNHDVEQNFGLSLSAKF